MIFSLWLGDGFPQNYQALKQAWNSLDKLRGWCLLWRIIRELWKLFLNIQ